MVVSSSAAGRPRLGMSLIRLVRFIVLAARRAEERRTLLELDADRLRDIGVIRHEARREASRWFWDGRAHRL